MPEIANIQWREIYFGLRLQMFWSMVAQASCIKFHSEVVNQSGKCLVGKLQIMEDWKQKGKSMHPMS